MPAVRQLTFYALAAFILLGPFFAQVLGLRTPLIRRWVMFSGYGADVCLLRYERVEADGALTPVDRCAALGFEGCSSAPKGVRLITNKDEADAQSKRLCKALGPAVDLRLYAQCGTPRGWKTKYSGQRNICEVMAELDAEPNAAGRR